MELTDQQKIRLRALVNKTEEIRQQAREAEERLSELTKTLSRYESDLIPNLLSEFDCEEVTLDDGTSVSIGRKLTVSPTKDNREAVAQWAESIGRGDLVARSVSVDYRKGDDLSPKNLVRYLQRRGVEYTLESTIHPSSLKALVERMMEGGKLVPEELLGVFVLKKAIIKQPVFEGEV